MIARNLIACFIALSATWIVGCTEKQKPVGKAAVDSALHEDPNGYWTCTMHPQVHMHESGKCPICGMPLVLVNKTKQVAKVEAQTIEASDDQIKNSQIAKYTVIRGDLEVRIPASGRIISSRQVAFQVYESDVSSVKVGYGFTGSSSLSSGQKLKGRISRVDNLLDPSSRTLRVDGTLEGAISNASADGAFHGEISNVLKDQIVIPEDAVLHTGTRDLVYVFSTNNKLEPREVQVGQKGKNQYQVLSGLSVGEVISSGPNFLIDSEAKLRSQ